jgi:hypothetical protein
MGSPVAKCAEKSVKAMSAKLGPLDLFGQVPVSHHDVYAWLLMIAQIDPESPRAEAYAKRYSVVDKIIRAKCDLSFAGILERAENDLRYQQLVASTPEPIPGRTAMGLSQPIFNRNEPPVGRA